MNSRVAVAWFGIATGILGLSYALASGRPLDHGIGFVAILIGFVISDRRFWNLKSRY